MCQERPASHREAPAGGGQAPSNHQLRNGVGGDEGELASQLCGPECEQDGTALLTFTFVWSILRFLDANVLDKMPTGKFFRYLQDTEHVADRRPQKFQFPNVNFCGIILD